MNRKLSLYVVVGATVAVLVAATGAFSVASADRSVQLDVTDDPGGLVGVSSQGVATDNQTQDEPLLTLSNRFTETASVELTIDDGPGPAYLDDDAYRQFDLESGEDRTVKGSVGCSGGPANEEWHVQITVSSDGSTVELDRTLDVYCTGDGPGDD